MSTTVNPDTTFRVRKLFTNMQDTDTWWLIEVTSDGKRHKPPNADAGSVLHCRTHKDLEFGRSDAVAPDMDQRSP